MFSATKAFTVDRTSLPSRELPFSKPFIATTTPPLIALRASRVARRMTTRRATWCRPSCILPNRVEEVAGRSLCVSSQRSFGRKCASAGKLGFRNAPCRLKSVDDVTALNIAFVDLSMRVSNAQAKIAMWGAH